MKKRVSLLLMFIVLAMSFSGCSNRQIERGTWKDGVYYNKYGDFKIVTNSYFDIYSDKKIKKELGAVYVSDTVLNDMLISSDYCAMIITVEKTSPDCTAKDYVDQFIRNTQTGSANGTYGIADSFTQEIAGKKFTCVPIKYTSGSGENEISYYEYDFIYKAEDGIFIIVRITAGDTSNIAAPLGMIRKAD